MPADRWSRCLARVLQHEGGYVDHPADPGGATNMGITHKTLARWRGLSPWQALDKAEVRALTRAEAADIYKALYWERVQADLLPAGLDLAVFDFAVNSGPERVVKMLQALVGAAQDGIVGPMTLAAVGKFPATRLIEALCEQRLRFLQSLTAFPTFGRGWTARVADIRLSALADAATTKPQTETPEMNLLNGYKTYAIGALMLIVGLAQIFGLAIPAFGDYSGSQLVMEALAIIFLRRGLKTELERG